MPEQMEPACRSPEPMSYGHNRTWKVLLVDESDRSVVDAALQAGASGYILTKSIFEELLPAIETVLTGKLYVSPQAGAEILEEYRRTLQVGQRLSASALARSDRLLLQLIAQGLRSQ